MTYPHETNLEGKIKKSVSGSAKQNDLILLKADYLAYRGRMEAIDYDRRRPIDFDNAANEINNYFDKVDHVMSTHGISSQSKLRSTVLEEVNTYLFAKHPTIASGTMEIFNKQVYAGIVVDKNLGYKLQIKDIDFCVGKEGEIAVAGVARKARFPFVCVEVKTYLDATMNHDVLFSGTQIKTASPEAKVFVLMEYQDSISADHPIPASYAYAIDKSFFLRNCKRDSQVITPIVGQYLLDYYIEVAQLL